jgi:hypothetical protein
MGVTLLERAIAKARRSGRVREDFARDVLGCSRYHLWRATAGKRPLTAQEQSAVRTFLASADDK